MCTWASSGQVLLSDSLFDAVHFKLVSLAISHRSFFGFFQCCFQGLRQQYFHIAKRLGKKSHNIFLITSHNRTKKHKFLLTLNSICMPSAILVLAEINEKQRLYILMLVKKYNFVKLWKIKWEGQWYIIHRQTWSD